MAKILAETVTVMGEHLTVDLIVWRKFRKPMPGLVEKVFHLNPGLAANGEFLALGTVFTIPEVDDNATSQDIELISLWA